MLAQVGRPAPDKVTGAGQIDNQLLKKLTLKAQPFILRSMRYLVIYLTLILLTSCIKFTSEPAVPYFKFDASAKEWLSEQKLNDTIHFTGTNGTKRSFVLYEKSFTKKRVTDCGFVYSLCNDRFDYDRQEYHFARVDSPAFQADLFISKTMYPANLSSGNVPADNKAKFSIGGYFWPYNAKEGFYFGFPLDFLQYNYRTYSNSVRTYREVIDIYSGNNDEKIDGAIKRTINFLGIDKRYGLVYFTDVYGNRWNRTN